MNLYLKHTGFIEVVTGSMFSGKTEELIRRLRRAKIAKQKLIVFKPEIDTRYGDNDIVSHSKDFFEAKPLKSIEDIYNFEIDKYDIVAIDEAQFFSNSIVNIAEEIANKGKRVIIAGLDLDYMGRPFGPIPNLMAIAEFVTKTKAICTICGNPATRSQRIIKSDQLVVLGAKAQYEPRCRLHFNPKGGDDER